MTLGLVAVVAGALLLLAVAVGPISDALHPVVTVNGTTVTRPELRARVTLDAAIADARRAVVRTLLGSGEMEPADASRQLARIDAEIADPIRSAIDGIVRDQILRAEADDAGIGAAPDVKAELATAVTGELGRRVRVVVIAEPPVPAAVARGGIPAPPSRQSSPDAALQARMAVGAYARAHLDSGDALDIVQAELEAGGWRVSPLDTWMPVDGPVDGLPDAFVGAARALGGPGPVPDVVDPLTGEVVVGDVVATTIAMTPVPIDVDGIDSATIAHWADARQAEHALRATMAAHWGNDPIPLIRTTEIVVGPAAVEGSTAHYASFAHLDVAAVPPAIRGSGTIDQAAADLATALRSLDENARARRFADLVAAANASGSPDNGAESGETLFFTPDQLLPDLRAEAVADDAQIGDVIGPISTAAGPELFLLRATFEGALDDRSNAALVEARTTDDPLDLARRVSPEGRWMRAAGTLWRAVDEFAANIASKPAVDATPLGQRTAPLALGGDLFVVQPEERRTAPAPSDVVMRLKTEGFEIWVAARIAAATIVRDPEPLPGILVDSPTPGMARPADQSPDVPAPNLPSIGAP